MTEKHPFSTRRGRKLRAAKLSASPLCERCTRPTPAAHVHHITPLDAGGDAWSWTNLEALCENCHKQHHGARPRTRTDPKTGLPMGDHWWWGSK